MSSAFNTATQAFDAWLSRRCREALTSETLKIWRNTHREHRFNIARSRLASFLGGVFAGAQAAGDEVVAEIKEDDVDFSEIADRWLADVADDGR